MLEDAQFIRIRFNMGVFLNHKVPFNPIDYVIYQVLASQGIVEKSHSSDWVYLKY